MKAPDFENISRELLNHCWDTMFSKSKEYASDEDRLANFKQPTSLLEANPAEVCVYYDMKHIASIVKMAKDANNGNLPTEEMLREKVGDYLNYGLLFYACMIELMENEKNIKNTY